MEIIQPSRRLFLGAAAGLIAAPAIVRSSSLMKIVVPKSQTIFDEKDEMLCIWVSSTPFGSYEHQGPLGRMEPVRNAGSIFSPQATRVRFVDLGEDYGVVTFDMARF